MGHEDQFPRPSLNGACRLGEETFARTDRYGQDAPISVVRHPQAGPGQRSPSEHLYSNDKAYRLMREAALANRGLQDPTIDTFRKALLAENDAVLLWDLFAEVRMRVIRKFFGVVIVDGTWRWRRDVSLEGDKNIEDRSQRD